MKYSKYIKFFGIAAIMALSACADDINIGDADENKYTTADGLTVYMCDGDGRTTYSLTELREQGTVDLYPTAGDKATTSVSVMPACPTTKFSSLHQMATLQMPLGSSKRASGLTLQ